jgi:hypothetical protein
MPVTLLTVLLMSRTLIVFALAATYAFLAPGANAGTVSAGALSGTWGGVISGSPGLVMPQHILIVVNAQENGGSWKLSASCYGSLELDSISGGYHHYLRTPAVGATCAGGDVDCLKLVGLRLDDEVTSHVGGRWDSSGTLHRVRAA